MAYANPLASKPPKVETGSNTLAERTERGGGVDGPACVGDRRPMRRLLLPLPEAQSLGETLWESIRWMPIVKPHDDGINQEKSGFGKREHIQQACQGGLALMR